MGHVIIVMSTHLFLSRSFALGTAAQVKDPLHFFVIEKIVESPDRSLACCCMEPAIGF